MTERLDSNKILEGNDYEGEIQLLLSIKYIVILVDPTPPPPILNMPHYMSFVFYKTKVRDYQ